MKQIKILLSSVLTLLLITGNNVSYASPHIRDFSPKKFKANKPNMNAFKGQVRKGNVNAFKGQARKGNALIMDSRQVGISPNRNSGGRLHNNNGFRSIPGQLNPEIAAGGPFPPYKGRFNALNMPFNSNVRSGGNNTCVENIVGGTMCSARKSGAKTQIKFRGQEGQSSISRPDLGWPSIVHIENSYPSGVGH